MTLDGLVLGVWNYEGPLAGCSYCMGEATYDVRSGVDQELDLCCGAHASNFLSFMADVTRSPALPRNRGKVTAVDGPITDGTESDAHELA